MHAEQRRGTRGERLLVIGSAGAVGRADLDHPRAGKAHHVRHAEGSADLDLLAPRHDDLAALAQRGEREQHGGRVVVDDQRGLGTEQADERRGEESRSLATLASGQVQLEIAV